MTQVTALSSDDGLASNLAPQGRRDWFEWVVLFALSALAFAVLGGLFLRTIVKGGVVTGGDGFLVVDPLQYLNWLRQSSQHLAAANLYDFGPLNYTFVHPGILLSGLAYRLGAGLVLSYALAKPFAIAALFFGVMGMVHRHIPRQSDRRVATVVALFYCAPAAAVAGWMLEPGAAAKFQLDFAGGETWTGSYLWGYVFSAVAVGLVPLGLLAWERGRDGQPKMVVLAAACAVFAAWLQPWQGATLMVAIAVTEAIRFRSETRSLGAVVKSAAPVLVAPLVPLIYYFVLSKTDPAWELAGKANDLPRWSVWVLVATLAPLAIPAVWSYRRGGDRWASAGSVALRMWPIAALLVYYAPLGTFPFHAVQGIQFPLAVLAVLALRDVLKAKPLGLLLGVVLVGVLVVPGTAYRVAQMRDAVNAGLQPFFLTSDEQSALRWLDDNPQPGGVVTENYLATVIPAYTGRQSWLGADSWTPQSPVRRKQLDRLFAGQLTVAQARELLVRKGAGFILEDCRAKPGFFATVRTFTSAVWKRGCVTVLRISGIPAE